MPYSVSIPGDAISVRSPRGFRVNRKGGHPREKGGAPYKRGPQGNQPLGGVTNPRLYIYILAAALPGCRGRFTIEPRASPSFLFYFLTFVVHSSFENDKVWKEIELQEKCYRIRSRLDQMKDRSCDRVGAERREFSGFGIV